MKDQLNKGPGFDWKYSPSEQGQHIFSDFETETDHVVKAVKNVVHNVLDSATTVASNIITVVSEQSQVDHTELTSTIGTTIVVNETTNSSILTDVFQSNSTVLAANDTIITEMSSTNNTVITTMDDVVNNTSFSGDTSIVDTVITTTESIVTTTTNAITSMMPTTESSTTEENTYFPMPHENYIEDKTLYIVLGVILGALIVVMIILLVVYKRYKNNLGQRSGVYCVTDFNEVRISSTKGIHTA